MKEIQRYKTISVVSLILVFSFGLVLLWQLQMMKRLASLVVDTQEQVLDMKREIDSIKRRT